MAQDLCVKRAMDDDKHSSPMPMIGLYIAGASLVCFLFMVLDILYGIRRRKPWLPCRFFKLNSLTLTLLSIATKLPVDLTTSMPSSHDQLSKLTGTAFICISMGFFMPSLGIMGDKDGFANMASLTILVVAVVVNVCIQMSTGVIFSFIVEHVIILFCMLTLLVVMWSSMSFINFEKTICTDRTKDVLLNGDTKGQSSDTTIIERLKLCYVHGYSSNPQLILFQSLNCSIISVLSTFCSIVVLEVVLRSLALNEFKFCEQVSDYGWSMKIVVVTQILTVLVVSVATSFRWLTFVYHYHNDSDETFADLRHLDYKMMTFQRHYMAVMSSKMIFLKIFRSLGVLGEFVQLVMQIVLFMMNGLVFIASIILVDATSMLVLPFAMAMRNIKKQIDAGATNLMTEEFQDVFYSVLSGLKEWMIRIGVEDMEKWMKVNKKRISPNHPFQLLLKTPPSEPSLANDIQRMGQGYRPDKGTNKFFVHYNHRVSCLSIVVLVLVATISIPSTLSGSLIHTLEEVFEIIYFIDNKMNAVSLGNKLTWMVTKDVWMDRDIIIRYFQKDISNVVSNGVSQSQRYLDHALGIINKLRDYNLRFVDPEVMIITNFIKNRDYTSVEDLYNYIEQVFVDMLHSFLINLPCAIFNDILESPAEECEERARLGLKFLCKLESLEDKVQWSFPKGTNITSLLTTTHAPTTDTHHSTQMEHGDAIVALHVNEDVSNNIPTTLDEITEEIV